jgi:hypothetical protein
MKPLPGKEYTYIESFLPALGGEEGLNLDEFFGFYA